MQSDIKTNALKAAASALVGGIMTYLGIMAAPLIVLIVVMVVDYISGMTKAWFRSELSSKIGLKGIVKKLCYMLTVCAAACVDWLCISGFKAIGIEYKHGYYFGVVVVIWLIINELISILENLEAIGVPLPGFMATVVKRLKNTVEEKNGGEPKNAV